MPDADPSPADVPPEAAAAAAEPVAAADPSPAACGARLAELFPALFAGLPLKPIKLRIQLDIQERAPGLFSKRTLSIFFHRHTTSTAYLKALVHNPQRFDLDGVAAGEVAAEHREAAAVELERRRGLHEARRAAEREAQREAEKAVRRERDAEFDARRERAALLRAFETTTLTRANFCALKGLAEADLESRLTLARSERDERPPRPAQPHPPQAHPAQALHHEGGQPFERKHRPRPPQRPASR